MNLNNLLSEKRSVILKKWCDLTLQTYPEESQSFFRKKDQFANPVGHTISEGLASIYEGLLEGADVGRISEFLDRIIRVRAIQEFSPSEAVSFVFGLKSIIREELGSRILQNGLSEEWAALDARIDGLALLCFDIYAQCRQKIFDIRVNEVRKRSHRLLQMAGLSYEISEDNENNKDNGDLQEDK
ncbi:MAG: RsbRD N-terminal domain-containing protein [Desulfobacterales bacterium]|nr:RsbRD N-terminal domain-containing protein [Desulfobacterales bacterium]